MAAEETSASRLGSTIGQVTAGELHDRLENSRLNGTTRAAVEAFFFSVARPLKGAARGGCWSDDEIETVVSDAVKLLLDELPNLPRDVRVLPWLRRTVYLNACNLRRKQGRRRRYEVPVNPGHVTGIAASSPNPYQQVASEQLAKMVWGLLDELPPDQRTVFVLTEVEELTAPEVAEIVGIPVNTVRSRLGTARKAAKELLAPLRPLLEKDHG